VLSGHGINMSPLQKGHILPSSTRMLTVLRGLDGGMVEGLDFPQRCPLLATVMGILSVGKLE
jgi:hypothetical protein